MQWYKYFHEVKDEMFWMEIFVPLHEWKNIHYLFYVTCTKIQIPKQIQNKKHWKMILAQAKHFTGGASNSTVEVLRGRLHHAKHTHLPAFALAPRSLSY